MSETVVITGANRGIGLALVREYIKRNCNVFGLCRSASDDLSASGARVIEGVNVAQPESIHSALEQLQDVKIDILINNAGVFEDEKLGSIDYNAVLRQLAVNALGPLRVTEALLNNLGKGSKVAMITSRMGSIADNGSGGYYGYRMSKAALNAAGVSLARDLQARGIAVALLHPGFVKTRMVDYGGDVTPEVAAARLAQRIDELNLDNSGGFWHANGERLPW
jgi:NAD(P)-dependent dehydrogenase (short-subunit alcohol dehydrogenase family)